MNKSLMAANTSEKYKYKVPRSVQQSLPIRRIYGDGIWLVGGKHSKTWQFTDINYIAASDDDKRSIVMGYSGIINTLPTDATAKITIFNRRINPTDFERRILMKRKNDGLDHYRAESNRINKGRAKASNNLIQSKYVTLSVPERKLQDSRAYFRRVGNNLGKSFSRLSSDLAPLNNHDRLRIFHDFFRPGEERYYGFDEAEAMYWGLDFRDVICPDGMQFRADCFKMGKLYGRVLFLRDYASYIKDEIVPISFLVCLL